MFLKEIREKNNLTIKQIAKETKITQQTYKMFENGKKVPSIYFLKQFAKITDTPLSSIFKKEEIKTVIAPTDIGDLDVSEALEIIIERGNFKNQSALCTWLNVTEGAISKWKDRGKISKKVAMELQDLFFNDTLDMVDIQLHVAGYGEIRGLDKAIKALPHI